MFARTPALPRGLPFGHQLVESGLGFREQPRVLRVARRLRSLFFGSEQVFGTYAHFRWGI